MRLLSIITLVLCAGCDINQKVCENKGRIASAQGVDDAVKCAPQLDDWSAETCSGGDRSPYLNYIASFCGTAELSCLTSTDELYRLCFTGADTGDTGVIQAP